MLEVPFLSVHVLKFGMLPNCPLLFSCHFYQILNLNLSIAKKEEILLRRTCMTQAPTPAEISKGQSDNTNNATRHFDNKAVSDQLRTGSWSN